MAAVVLRTGGRLVRLLVLVVLTAVVVPVALLTGTLPALAGSVAAWRYRRRLERRMTRRLMRHADVPQAPAAAVLRPVPTTLRRGA